jgi:PAS domain S-box-containing protein
MTTDTAEIPPEAVAAALDASETGLWQWDVAAGRVVWSESLGKLHGLGVGKCARTMEQHLAAVHPDERDRVAEELGRAVDTGALPALEYRILRPDGTVRWLEARARALELGGTVSLAGTCTDVTARRRREDDLRRAQAETADHGRLAALTADVGFALTQSTSLTEMLQRCAQSMVDRLGAAFARIWTLDETSQVLLLQTSAGMYTHTNGPHGRVPVGKFKIGLIAEEREPHLTNQVVDDPRVGDQEWAKREGMVAFAGYPLIVGDHLLGVLAMFARHPLSDADFRALETVANGVALGIARTRGEEARERRAAELASLAGELRYQRDLTTTIADNTASALFMMDASGFPLFMNAAASTLTGYSGVDEIRGRELHHAIHFRKPDGSPYPMEECPIDRANAEIVPLRAQRETFCRKDGSLFPVEFNLAPIVRDGQPLGAVIEARDITRELEAQQALEESDERFHLVARATNDAIWDWDFAAGTVWWNEGFEAMFGYPLASLEPGPESWTGRIHPDDRERISHGIHEAIESTSKTWTDEYRFRRADGTWAEILDRGILVRDESGTARRMIGSMMDISDRKRAERDLRERAEELLRLTSALERSNRDLDQFAYAASHDLKAPLRGIANLALWTEEELGEAATATVREYIAKLRGRVHRMEALIDGILAYSRAGRVAAPPEPVAVARLVRDVVDLLSPPAGLRIEVPPDLPVLQAERAMLQQVFMNLIGNAVKHAGGPGGVVTVGWAREGDWFNFTVADDGPGIAPAFQDRIWGIFQTLAPRDKVEGTGIGLALVKKIVESRGGRVWLESAEGKGALFGFTWPAGPAKE